MNTFVATQRPFAVLGAYARVGFPLLLTGVAVGALMLRVWALLVVMVFVIFFGPELMAMWRRPVRFTRVGETLVISGWFGVVLPRPLEISIPLDGLDVQFGPPVGIRAKLLPPGHAIRLRDRDGRGLVLNCIESVPRELRRLMGASEDHEPAAARPPGTERVNENETLLTSI